MTAPLLREERLYSLVASYLEALEAGRVGEAERLLAEQVDLAADVRRLLDEQSHLAGLAAPFLALASLGTVDGRTLPAAGPAGVPGSSCFGDYELLDMIAQGGMGVVYKARHRKLNRLVALKMVLTGPWSTPADVLRFHTEVQAAAELDHPHIVPIYEVGCNEGQHFYVMKLIEGPSLAQVLADNRGGISGQDAARLMVTVARAIQHAHQRGILHRDLKPANVLLASGGRQSPGLRNPGDCRPPLATAPGDCRPPLADLTPFVADFGLAKRVPTPDSPPTAAEEQTLDGAIVGTPSYMAPEQAAGLSKRLSTLVDVWGLGAILYELLSGQPPFRGAHVLDTLQKIQNEEPARPRSLVPGVDRDLETICLKCLQKEPTQRYRSAAALADDLERWLARRPIHARPVGNVERLWRWCLRNSTVAGLTFTMLALLVAAAGAALSVAAESETRVVEEAGFSNLFAARGAASTILWHLDHLGKPLVRAAQGDELRQLMRARDLPGLNRFCAALHDEQLPGGDKAYQNCYILDVEGRMLAESPPVPRPPLRPFGYRNYFQGAMSHARAGRRDRAGLHLSRVFQGTDDATTKLGLALAVHSGDGKDAAVLGVLVATVRTSSTLGSLELDDGKRTTVLVGREDTANPDGDYVIMLHPGYRAANRVVRIESEQIRAVQHPHLGEEFTLPPPVQAIDRDYRDPVGGDHAGRWLAGFAPVGNTECVVIVQQRYEAALASEASLARHLLLWGGVALLLGTGVTVALHTLAQRRR